MLRWLLGVPLLVTLLYTYKNVTIEETKTVETIYGPVVGQHLRAPTQNFMAFRGIPYAKPPTGELRFRAPQPPNKWNTTKRATKFAKFVSKPSRKIFTNINCDKGRPSLLLRVNLHRSKIVKSHVVLKKRGDRQEDEKFCFWSQAPGSSHEELGNKVRNFIRHAANYAKVAMQLNAQSEDCLTLNVYTLQLDEVDRRPVLVFFYGGGFYSGDGTDALYGPEYLVEEHIVVVTVNYRLGPLGFLSTNTSDASGNWGLKDQVAALKWVRDNIVKFGGEPDQVTIYGQSAGAASVHYHLLSPLSKGLFHRAIMSSGAATSDWAVNQQQERLTRNVARLTGASKKDIEDPARCVQHLRKVGVKLLMKLMWRSMEETVPWEQDSSMNTKGFIPFVPVVEPPGTPGAFLTEDPKVIMSEGRYNRVPVMMGFNDLDGGVLFTGPTNYSSPRQLKKENIDVCLYLPNELRSSIEERNACPEVTQNISEIYFGGKSSKHSPLGFVKFFGDRAIIHFIYASQKWFARYADKTNPAYFYYFKYDGEWNFVKDLYHFVDLPGVTHWDELIYVFKQKIKTLTELSLKSPGYVTQQRMISFITNFVKYGSPTSLESSLYIPWEPANAIDHNTIVIDANLKMENDLLKERMEFWNTLYQIYSPKDYYL